MLPGLLCFLALIVIGFVIWMNVSEGRRNSRSFRQEYVDGWIISCRRCETVFQLEPSDSFKAVSHPGGQIEVAVTCPSCNQHVCYTPYGLETKTRVGF